MGFLEVWYDRIDEGKILDTVPPRFRRETRAILDKARAKGHMRALDRLTEEVNGKHQIIEDIPLIVRETHLADGTPIDQALDAMLRSYLMSLPDDRRRLLSRYRIIDVARKVVGVGSVGTGCWVLLLEGLDREGPERACRDVLNPAALARRGASADSTLGLYRLQYCAGR
jgi:hypothetical protein